MVERELARPSRPGVIHLDRCDRRRVVRQEVVVGHGGVAGDEGHCRQAELDHEWHERRRRRRVGEHEWGGEIEEHPEQPRLRLQRTLQGGLDGVHVRGDEGVAQPRKAHDADRRAHARAEGRLSGDRRGWLPRQQADDDGTGEHHEHDGGAGTHGRILHETHLGARERRVEHDEDEGDEEGDETRHGPLGSLVVGVPSARVPHKSLGHAVLVDGIVGELLAHVSGDGGTYEGADEGRRDDDGQALQVPNVDRLEDGRQGDHCRGDG